jgi:molybdopterin converting factor subunit 1
MPTIRILLFAAAADAFGARQVDLEVGSETCAGDLVDLMSRQGADAAAILGRSALAVNERYATRTTPVREGDVVAVIPPVSGG